MVTSHQLPVGVIRGTSRALVSDLQVFALNTVEMLEQLIVIHLRVRGTFGDLPLRVHVLGLVHSPHELWVGDTAQAVGEQLEGLALWQQHQQAIQSLDQVGVVLHIEQLQAQVGEDGAFDELYQLVDLHQEVYRHLQISELLDEVVGVSVVLREETERHGGHGVVAPGAIQAAKQSTVLLSAQVLQLVA